MTTGEIYWHKLLNKVEAPKLVNEGGLQMEIYAQIGAQHTELTSLKIILKKEKRRSTLQQTG